MWKFLRGRQLWKLHAATCIIILQICFLFFVLDASAQTCVLTGSTSNSPPPFPMSSSQVASLSLSLTKNVSLQLPTSDAANPFPTFGEGVSWTISFWIYPQPASVSLQALDILTAFDSNNRMDCSRQIFKLSIFNSRPAIAQCQQLAFNGSVIWNRWNHLLYSYDSNLGFQMYLNGESLSVVPLEAAVHFNPTQPPITAVYLNPNIDLNMVETNYSQLGVLFAMISGLRIYSRSLTGCEVLSDMNGLLPNGIRAEYITKDGQIHDAVGLKDRTSYFLCSASSTNNFCDTVPAPNVTTLNNCPAGFYSLSPVYDGPCQPCPEGTFRANPGGFSSASCSPCPSGTFAKESGSISCTGCGVGRFYSAAEWVKDCLYCPAGTFNDQHSSSACTPCGPGKYSSLGALTCSVCNPGYYSTGGAESCIACSPGTYSASSLATSCDECGEGRSSSYAASYCFLLPASMRRSTFSELVTALSLVGILSATLLVFFCCVSHESEIFVRSHSNNYSRISDGNDNEEDEMLTLPVPEIKYHGPLHIKRKIVSAMHEINKQWIMKMKMKRDEERRNRAMNEQWLAMKRRIAAETEAAQAEAEADVQDEKAEWREKDDGDGDGDGDGDDEVEPSNLPLIKAALESSGTRTNGRSLETDLSDVKEIEISFGQRKSKVSDRDDLERTNHEDDEDDGVEMSLIVRKH